MFCNRLALVCRITIEIAVQCFVQLLLPTVVAQQGHARRNTAAAALVPIVSHYGEVLPALVQLYVRVVFLLLCSHLVVAAINVVEDRILYSTETKPTVKHCAAVVFVPLSEPRVLV